MKDFGKKLQTNVPVTESESESSYPDQIPISERIYTPFSHKDAKESNTNNPILPILRLKQKLQKKLEKQQVKIADKKVQEFPFMLASAAAKSIIKSYNEGEEINGVPLDKRRYGKMVFDDHITYNIKPNENKADGYRTPLLCNHGISGSGKTVQQALNMHWFIDRFKNGVAIEIIFNDDAFSLMVPIASIRDAIQFKLSLVRIIILRLIEFCYGRNYSCQPTASMNKYLTWDFNSMLHELYPVGSSLEIALKFVRDVLGLPDDAPILLAVDELLKLKKSDNEKDMSEIVEYLRIICSEMDNSYQYDIAQRRDRTFWLSVSFYGCFPLTKFITNSNREINLQPLSPIFPIPHNLENFDILPPILQCFKKENRKKIVPTEKNMEFLKQLSLLLMKSGGHPRRVSALMTRLFEIEFKFDYLTYDNYCENYVDSKLTELQRNNWQIQSMETPTILEEAMDAKFEFGIRNSFVEKSFVSINSENNDALQNMVQPFSFPSLTTEEQGKNTTLILDAGYGSYVPALGKAGFLFIPYPVIEKAKHVIPFFNSLDNYFTKTKFRKRGKNLEICVCDALNFYAKNCEDITLANICCSHGKNGLFSWELETIPNFTETTFINFCPSVLRNYSSLDYINFGELAGLSPGFYLPRDDYNNTADVIGILNVKKTNNTNVKRLILFIQLKDWFKDTAVKNHIIDEWRWSQQFATESDVFLTRKKEEKSMNQFNDYWKEHKDHMPVFLIFSANKIDSISNTGEFSNDVTFSRTTQYKENHLRENEGTMNLEHSKNWFPTFGYNLQAAHKLSQLWEMVPTKN